MCVNYREASQRGRSCPRRANAEAPSIEAIQQAVADAFEVKSRRPLRLAANAADQHYPEQVRMARKAALYLCRELTEHKCHPYRGTLRPQIGGRETGGRVSKAGSGFQPRFGGPPSKCSATGFRPVWRGERKMTRLVRRAAGATSPP